MKKLSVAMENYLEVIYELSVEGQGARVSDIATKMNVAKASVNNARKKLAKDGFIEDEKYNQIVLTNDGRKAAEFIMNKHEIINKFLVDVLGVEKNIADEDACTIEHVISYDSVIKMQEFIQQYKKPHNNK